MITLYSNKKDCCGCTACKSICPNQAITMKSDEEGFLYPVIDKTTCVECGLCKSVCPIQNEITMQEYFLEPLVYALKHKSNNVRMSSSSGGAYTAISDLVLAKKNSICYGAAFNKDLIVHHTAATTTDERDQFRGSKYVQSDLGSTFNNIKQNLIDGKTVLFTGTPCQTAGLAKFLEVIDIDTNNLILNDIICYGTPSPKLWNDYKEFLEDRRRSKLQSFTFRFKENGWRGFNVRAEYEDGECELNTQEVRGYIQLFNRRFALRPSCYYCKFTNIKRPSDITMADFWGVEKCLPEFDDNVGISLMLLNTIKGKAVFEQIKNGCHIEQSNTIDCLQNNLQRPTQRPTNLEKFWQDYEKHGYDYVARKYVTSSTKTRIKGLTIKLLQKAGLLNPIKGVLRR